MTRGLTMFRNVCAVVAHRHHVDGSKRRTSCHRRKERAIVQESGTWVRDRWAHLAIYSLPTHKDDNQ